MSAGSCFNNAGATRWAQAWLSSGLSPSPKGSEATAGNENHGGARGRIESNRWERGSGVWARKGQFQTIFLIKLRKFLTDKNILVGFNGI